MLDSNGDAGGGERGEAVLWPLDEDHGVVEVRLQITPFRRREPAEAEQVEMG